jgi:CRP/FNR family transcriptional regulator, cyclic AMP receptor protein
MCGVTDLLNLCAGLPMVWTPAGGVLIEQGERPDRLMVLVDGEVTIERDGTPLARVDTPGAVFGEMSVVLGNPATATVRAASDVRVRPRLRCCARQRPGWTA